MEGYNAGYSQQGGCELAGYGRRKKDNGNVFSMGQTGMPDHMEKFGVSVPVPAPHGYGRRHLIPMDHQVTRADYEEQMSLQDDRLQNGQGRKLIVPFDHMKCDVLKPLEEIQPVKCPTNSDMKEALKDWLVTVQDMFVFDEGKWATEVIVEPRGCHWVVEALTQTMKSVSREGPTAKLIAEKLAMMPNSELRYFGLRFAGPNDPKPIRREKHATEKENRSFVSPGVQDSMSRDCQKGLQTMSSIRKHPSDPQRRYISSGQDHFLGERVEAGDRPGTHGHAKDDDFDDMGLERGMGKGRRFIGTKDHLFGGGALG